MYIEKQQYERMTILIVFVFCEWFGRGLAKTRKVSCYRYIGSMTQFKMTQKLLLNVYIGKQNGIFDPNHWMNGAIPAGTQRCFNVHLTLYGCYER